ncbi:MAG: 1-phosphofructokinase family hexose kinase [Candidatus Atribacteria bacterium]|nr:1-phosphofructokinase family hexose kinase [Candidatus Atribacteria bacterium]
MILVVTPNPCLDRTLFVKEHRGGGRIEVEKVQEVAGGKGSNVCRVLRELGNKAVHLLFLGGYVGERVFALLEQDGIESVPVWTEAPTRVVTTVVDREWRQVVYFEPPPVIQESEEAMFLAQFQELGAKATMVLLCGSIPPSLPYFYEKVLTQSQDKLVIIDGRGPFLRTLSRYPFGLKMNREEAELTWGKPLQSENDWQQFFHFFFDRGVEVFILTLGRKGALLGTPESFYGVVAPQVEVVNPVGSGDAFLAAFTHVFYNTSSLENALRWAVAAGTCNAMVWEAGRIEKTQVEILQNVVDLRKGRSWKEFKELLE